MIDAILKYLGRFPKLSLANTATLLGIIVGFFTWTLSRYEELRDYKADLEQRWTWCQDEVHELRDRVWMLENPNDPWTVQHKDDYRHK